MVIERPAAVASWAGLESLPGTVDHRARGDREHGADRGVDACRGVGDEPRAVGLDENLGTRSLRSPAHGVDRAHIQDLIVIGKRKGAESLANSYSAIEVVAREALPPFDEPTVREPVAQCFGADEDRASALGREVVMGVHEGLYQRELACRR